MNYLLLVEHEIERSCHEKGVCPGRESLPPLTYVREKAFSSPLSTATPRVSL